MFVVHMVGNAHIDPVWLWPWQAGVDEALATLAAAADRCDEYPEFVFTRGEAWLYLQAERLRPDLFARIRRLIAEGKWFVAGGTWVQPDLNLPTWELLRRQIVHGQAYFQDRFGVAPRIGYNVDSFGQPAFLPDLLTAHGYTGYVFGRPLPRQLRLPFAAFRWRGAGGGEIDAFRVIPGYAFTQADLRDHIETALANADPAIGHTMCFYGVGDHGGGPTRAQLDWILAHRTAIPGVELRLSTPAAFFAALAPQRDRLPVVSGELQHCFIGCYSVMADIKRAQRAAEHRLDQAARATRMLAEEPEQRDYQARIDAAWPDLLFTAFHDILGGTATPSAWRDCGAMQGRALLAAEEVLLDATRRWSHRRLAPDRDQRIVVANTADEGFDGLVETETWLDYEEWGDRFLATAEGDPIPFQCTQPDAMHRIPRLLFPLRVPPRDVVVTHIRPGPPPRLPTPPGSLDVSATRLANDRLALTVGPQGIASLALDGSELLAPSGLTLELRRDTTDTWSDGADRFAEPILQRLGNASWIVEEAGPLRASLRLEHRIGTSRLRWTLSLVRGEPGVSMRLEINFDEHQSLLQLAAGLAASPAQRTDAVAGGAIERPPGPEEYPFLGWSRASLGGADIALVTHDAFSLSGDGSDWRFSLLRSPRMAWQGGDPPVYHGRNHFTDQGVHVFVLRLCADTRLTDGQLDAEANRLAQPLITFDVTEGVARPLP